MKAVFLIISMIIGLSIANSTSLLAQTKKIAWRSHGGSNVTFTFDLPDDFGMVEPSYYERQRARNLRDSINSADSLAVCTPIQPIAPVLKTEKEKEAKKRQKRKEIRQEYRQDIKELKAEKKEALKAQAVTTTPNVVHTAAALPTPEGATQWLWLLLLPLTWVFVTSIKKP